MLAHMLTKSNLKNGAIQWLDAVTSCRNCSARKCPVKVCNNVRHWGCVTSYLWTITKQVVWRKTKIWAYKKLLIFCAMISQWRRRRPSLCVNNECISADIGGSIERLSPHKPSQYTVELGQCVPTVFGRGISRLFGKFHSKINLLRS